MKDIIEGKIYNTETAHLIGRHTDNPVSDMEHVDEGLYKTRRGNYFLAGEGGPMSKYARICWDDRSWTWGERIIPLTRQEAFDWAQQYLGLEEVEEEFSDLIEEA